MMLHTPKGYPPSDEDVCNGCGSKGLISWFVPNTLYGLNIEECCNIHDYMYHVGETTADKAYADITFLVNMEATIHSNGTRWLRWLRERRAMAYYKAVKYFGDTAFWCDKEESYRGTRDWYKD